MKSKKTRERILDASLELFNTKKASNVSTVQISAAMKISPGNLYYYYANKEDVIRCIWEERMSDVIDGLLKSTEEIKTGADIMKFMEASLQFMLDYRFFYTEISTLFVNDDKLIEIYRETDINMRDTFSALVERLGEEGKFIDHGDLERVIAVQNAVAAAKQMLDRYDLYITRGKSREEFIGYTLIRLVTALDPILEEEMRSEINADLEARGYTREMYLELIR